MRVRLTDVYPNLAPFARMAAETGGAVTREPRPRAEPPPSSVGRWRHAMPLRSTNSTPFGVARASADAACAAASVSRSGVARNAAGARAGT
jgi:hypothetical protein